MASLGERPNDPDLEEAVLGCLLIDPSQLEIVRPLVAEQAFYQIKWQWVYAAICALHDRGESVDILTVCDALDNDKLKQLGGPTTISRLINQTAVSFHAETYARKLRDLYSKRRLIEAAGQIAKAAYAEEPKEAFIHAMRFLDDAEPTSTATRRVGGDSIDLDMLEALEELHSDYEEIKSGVVTWPWPSMKKYIRAWRKGQPVILIAEGGAGKTAFCMEIAGFNAQNGGNIFYAHTEDEPKILLTRRLSTISGIPYSNLEADNYDTKEPLISVNIKGKKFTAPQAVFAAISSTKSWRGNLHFLDVSGMTVPEAIYELQRVAREVGRPDAVIYDWFLDHKMRLGQENEAMKYVMDLQDLKQYANKYTRILIAMQTGKRRAGQYLTAYDAHWTSSAAHYGKVVLTIKRERELINQEPIGAFKPEMKVFISKANLDQTGTFDLAIQGNTFHIYEPEFKTLPDTPWE